MNEQKLNEILNQKLEVFKAGGLNCSEMVLSVMCSYWDIDAPFVPMIATPFGGGIGASRLICGAVTGGLMAIGLKLGREEGGDRTSAYEAGKVLVEWVENKYGSHVCADLTGMKRGEKADSRKHGDTHVTVCRPLVCDVCRYLAETIE